MGMHPKINHIIFAKSFGKFFNTSSDFSPLNNVSPDLSYLSSMQTQTPIWRDFLDFIALNSDYSSKHGSHISPKSAIDIINNFLTISSVFGNDFKSFANRKNKTFLDYGSGVYRPLCVSLILYCNGFDSVYAFEPYAIKADFAWQSYWTLIREMLEDSDTFLIGDTPRDFYLSRLRELLDFDIKENLIHFSTNQIRKLSIAGISLFSDFSLIPKHSVDIHFSNAVLEHITNVSYEMSNVYQLVKREGIGFHIVDFADHRHYEDNYISPVEKYFDGYLDEINGLPPSSLESEIHSGGFFVQKYTAQTIPSSFIKNRLIMTDYYTKYDKNELLEHINFYKLTLV